MRNANETPWFDLWRRLGASGDPHEAYRSLVARYAEPHRAYHTLAHVDGCLAKFAEVRPLAEDPDAVEFAIWYHDAVYDTKAKDNEELSAALAKDAAKKAGFPASFCRRVVALIMATKHAAVPKDPDARLMVDIDLSILGEDEATFDEYERRIRTEYVWVPKDAFAAGRSAVLRSFLDRRHVYATWFFRYRYETRARANLARSLGKLTDRS